MSDRKVMSNSMRGPGHWPYAKCRAACRAEWNEPCVRACMQVLKMHAGLHCNAVCFLKAIAHTGDFSFLYIALFFGGVLPQLLLPDGGPCRCLFL